MKKAENKYSFLLIVPYTYPDFSGSGRNAFNFGKFLVKRNIPVKLLTFNRNLKYKKHEQIEGLVINRITYFNKNLFLKIISLLWILPVYIFQIRGNDVIYMYGSNLIAWQFIILSGKLLRKKIVFRSLLFGEDDIRSLLLKKVFLTRIFYKFLFRKIDCYFSINPSFSLEYKKILNKNDGILEMPQGVDIEIFHPVLIKERKKLREKLGLSESEFIIITVAFLLNRKGFSEIFEQLCYLKIPFKYIIVGEYNFGEDHFLSKNNKEASVLRNKGLQLLGSRLLFTGPVNEVNEYIQTSDLYLFNSKAEGLPNSMLEAMACGIPVVTNPIKGLEGYLLFNERNSVIFRTVTELNYLIKKLHNQPEMRESLGRNANETIKRIGTFDIVMQEISKKLKFEQ